MRGPVAFPWLVCVRSSASTTVRGEGVLFRLRSGGWARFHRRSPILLRPAGHAAGARAGGVTASSVSTPVASASPF
jgi:hypothetical protein